MAETGLTIEKARDVLVLFGCCSEEAATFTIQMIDEEPAQLKQDAGG